MNSEVGRVHQQRVTVRRRLRGDLGAYDALRAGAAVDDPTLALALEKLRRNCSCDDVGTAARRISVDDADGFRRIILRVCSCATAQYQGDRAEKYRTHQLIFAPDSLMSFARVIVVQMRGARVCQSVIR